MKRICAVLLPAFVLALIVPNFSRAQNSGYAVTERGANYRILQKTTVENGTNRVHQYMELAAGLNYTNTSGQLVESKEEIDILPTGGAAAVQGQHQVYFPADIYDGVLEVVTPDGRQLRSRPLGVCYDDGSNTVFIATLQHSQGVLTASNQVTYFDAFTDFKADLVCTYRRGGFECDLVFRQQPPAPDAYGLNDSSSTLQLVTEFFNTQDPQQIPSADDPDYGLLDSTLKFGALTMTHGKAFAVGSPNAKSAAVYKTWTHIQGRTFLIEELPLADLADALSTLPQATNALTSKVAGKLRMASNHRQMPPSHEFVADTKQIQIAATGLNKQPGVVLDYDEIDSSPTDFTFQDGTTYYLSDIYNLSGTTTFEGGAVLKFDATGSASGQLDIDVDGTVVCDSTPDHPTIFTSFNDDSVGETIDGSSGSPSVGDAFMFLYINPSVVLSNMCFNYGGYCIVAVDDLELWNCQFVPVDIALAADGDYAAMHNVLIQEVWDDNPIEEGDVFAENVTVDGNGYLNAPYETNCLIVTDPAENEGTGFVPSGGVYVKINDSGTPVYSSASIFQTGASANFYLATSSPYRGIGTTNINPDLLAELQTMTTYAPQDGGWPDTNGTDLGYHYPTNEDSDYDGLPDWWEYKYFGTHAYSGTNLDSLGNNYLYDYMNGLDPNIISFSFSVADQYVSTNIVGGVITILGGVPSYFSMLVDSTNFTTATWAAYTSSNITVNLGSTQGMHDVWIGLRGLPADAQQTWEETTLVLGTNSPTVTITNPVNYVSFNASRVDVSGNFAAGSLKQITVNGVLAFINNTNFEALNVPLVGGTNIVTAVVEDLNGSTNISSINIIGVTNTDGSMNDPVDLQAAPVAGFVPLPVAFSVQTNVPGTMQQVFYDFNGDDLADFVTNNLDSITNTYATNGEYFPVVTIQTTAGRFSSIGGWNAVALDSSNQPVQINVQVQPTATVFASITDPVDLKWAGTNLYVLSGSTATITEYATNGTTIRSLSGIGTSPSGLDVDGSGNVYVAMNGDNQVWKFNPTNTTFAADTSFGNGGYIGNGDASSGSDPGEFNEPFDVAVSADGGTLSVSDSGNNYIQQFDTNGNFLASFGAAGSAFGQFNTPKGLTYDSVNNLYIADSGNNRIAVAQDSEVLGVSGTNGTALGQFSGPVNISVDERGVYVADTGNNRIQSLNLLANGIYSFITSDIRFAVSTNLNTPVAVAAVDSLTNETFYVADTGNNQIVFYTLGADDPTPAWTNMTAHVATQDVSGAVSSFCNDTADRYRQSFLVIGADSLISDINQIGTLTPVFIRNDAAEYYFEKDIEGHTILFPVEFMKENGVWKIISF